MVCWHQIAVWFPELMSLRVLPILSHGQHLAGRLKSQAMHAFWYCKSCTITVSDVCRLLRPQLELMFTMHCVLLLCNTGIHPDPAAALRTSLITHGNPLFAGSPVQPATAVSTADDSHQVSGGVKGDGVTMQPTEASAPHASAVHPMTTREAHSSESLAALQADPGTNPAAEATTAAAASSLPAETAGDGALPSDSSPTAEDSASPDWQQVNQLLSANGFQTLQMQTASSKSMAADTRNASQDDNSTSPVQPDTQALHSVFLQVCTTPALPLKYWPGIHAYPHAAVLSASDACCRQLQCQCFDVTAHPDISLDCHSKWSLPFTQLYTPFHSGVARIQPP